MQPISELSLALTIATPSRLLPRAAFPEAVVPMKLPLSWFERGTAVDEHAVGVVAGDQVALRRPDEHAARRIVAAGRLAADEVVCRAIRHQDAVAGVAEIDGAGDVRADVVHGDLVVVRSVEADAVAAVAADHVRQLEADVDRRLEGNES